MIVMCSGGLDPLHVGHVYLLEHAATYGQVVVALNSDAWLVRKKGYAFMPWADRRRILMAIKHVSGVVAVQDDDGTVCEAIQRIAPRLFLNGGDRTSGNAAESALCKRMGIGEVFGVGGEKCESSSAIIGRVVQCLSHAPPIGSASAAVGPTILHGTGSAAPGSSRAP